MAAGETYFVYLHPVHNLHACIHRKDETAEHQSVVARLKVKLIIYTRVEQRICVHAYITKMRRLSIRVLQHGFK